MKVGIFKMKWRLPKVPGRPPLHQDTQGAVTVEFALVMPILLLIMIGIADFGRAFSHRMDMEAAARTTLQLLVVNSGASAPAMQSVIEQTLGNPGNLTWSITYSLECTSGTETLTPITTANVNAPPTIQCADGSVATGRWVNIVVSQPFSPIFTLYGFDQILTLTGNAYGRVQ